MQMQLVLNLQSTYHNIENLQLILYMQHAGPYFHLGSLSCFKLEARSEKLATDPWVAEPFSKWGGTSARQKTIESVCDLNWQL